VTGRARWRDRPSVAGPAALGWLLLVAFPIYFIAGTSLRAQGSHVAGGPLRLPVHPTLARYGRAIELGFGGYLRDSLVVSAATVLVVLLIALPAAYAIVRSRSRLVRRGFSMGLVGLAIPSQAAIVPAYLVIDRLHPGSMAATILPTVAFALPLSIVVLTGALRDLPGELCEAMTFDFWSSMRVFVRRVVPRSTPGVVTVGIFSGLSAWNGVLFPLVLARSRQHGVVTLDLWSLHDRHGTGVPGLVAAVALAALPALALYLFGRRYLLGGLAAGFGRWPSSIHGIERIAGIDSIDRIERIENQP
jgi:xylobiose transport system permease protein